MQDRRAVDPDYGLKVALLILLMFFLYLCGVTFWEVAPVGNEHAKTIVPYLLSIITLLIGFYWGSSHEKSKAGLVSPMTPVDEAAVGAAKIEAVKAVETAKTVVDEGKEEVK